MILFLAWLMAFGVAVAVCSLIVWRPGNAWLDQPGNRSLHTVAVPRIGGIGVCLGIATGFGVAWPVLSPLLDWSLLLSLGLLWLVALRDDRQAVSPVLRLLVQALAAGLAVFVAGIYLRWPWLHGLWPWLGVLALMWGTNLYNFMDGMDGLAGSMALIGFTALALLGWHHGDSAYTALCGVIAASAAGFLVLNRPPARLFMGDSGSTVLGFAMVALSVLGCQRGVFSLAEPLLVFSPFWVDASLTLLKRLFRGERVWQAHREHCYQRWVRAGYSHGQVLGGYALLMLACAGSAIAWQALASRYNEIVLSGIGVVGYTLVIRIAERALRRVAKVDSRE